MPRKKTLSKRSHVERQPAHAPIAIVQDDAKTDEGLQSAAERLPSKDDMELRRQVQRGAAFFAHEASSASTCLRSVAICRSCTCIVATAMLT